MIAYFFLQFCQFLLTNFVACVRCIFYCWYIFREPTHTITTCPFYVQAQAWSFNDAFYWKFYLNAQVLSMIFSANNLLCCFWTNHLKTCVQQHLKLALGKAVPLKRMKLFWNIFVLFLYWFCQVISVSIPTSWLMLFQAYLFSQ